MVGFHYQDAASAAVMMHPMQHLENLYLQPVVDMEYIGIIGCF